MDLFQNLDLLSVGATIAAIGVLGFTVFFNNRQSATNKSFFYLSLAAILWSASNYLSYQVLSPNFSIFVLRLVFFFAVWFAFYFFRLTYFFPFDKFKTSKFFNQFLSIIVILTSFLTLTPLVVSKISGFTPDGRVADFVGGVGIIIFGALVLFLLLGSFWQLVKKRGKAGDNISRLKLSLIASGTIISFSLLIFFNFIFPSVFGNNKFIPFGAVFIFPFIALTSYAILKHKLFNIRVAGTAVLVFLLAVVTFSEVILSHQLSQIVYRSSVFLLVLVFGITLIRGVLREVEQKERLQKLSDELASANEKLKELDKAKTEFVSIASHQLRAPLTAIKGYASLILEGSFGQFSDQIKKAVDIIFQSSQKLVTVIEDFLNITRIELGRMKYEMSDFDFKKLVEGVVGELRPSIEKKGLSLMFETAGGGDFTAHGDLGKLNQVVNNLIDNAGKYTKQGSITLMLSKATDPAHKVRLAIKDTGVGIDAETMGRLFQKFTRANDAGKINITGTGLGLYVAKQIVEAHGGRLWAESDGVGKGSTFMVEL